MNSKHMDYIIDHKAFKSLYEGDWVHIDYNKNSDHAVITTIREYYTLYNRSTETILTLRLNLKKCINYYEWSDNNLHECVIIELDEADDFVDYFFYKVTNKISVRPECRGLLGFIKDNLKDIILVKITLTGRSNGLKSEKIDYSNCIMPLD